MNNPSLSKGNVGHKHKQPLDLLHSFYEMLPARKNYFIRCELVLKKITEYLQEMRITNVNFLTHDNSVLREFYHNNTS